MPTLSNLPMIASIVATDPLSTNSDTVHYRVTFSKDVTGVTADQFGVVTTGSLNGAAVTSVTPVAGSSVSYDVTVAAGTGTGTLSLTVPGSNIRDGSGNQLSPFQSESVISGPRFSLVNLTAAGDVNGDGKTDLVLMRTFSALGYSLDVKLNDGTGHFSSVSATGASEIPLSIALADVNGDGKLDVLLGNGTTSTIDVRLGDGTGTFATATKYAAGSSPYIVAAADFNGDGRTDLLVRNGTSVSVMAGNGSGGFGSPTAATDLSATTFPILTGDFNGDGKLDLVAQNNSSSAVSLRLGNGDGTFQSASQIGTASTLFKGDFNDDGKLDLAFGTGNSVSVLLGNGDGTFASPQSFQTPANIRSAVAADVNGDGKSDIVVLRTDNTLSTFYGRGDGTFGPAMTVPLDSSAGGLTVADLNGDGNADVVVEYQTSNSFNGEDVLLTAHTPATPIYAINRAAAALAITDAAVTLGTDGNPYLNAAHYNGGTTTLSGTVAAGVTVTVTNAAGNSVVGTAVAGADGKWALNVSGLQDGGTYSYVASATDSSGITTSGSAFAFAVDASAPTLAVTHISGVGNSTQFNVAGTIGAVDAGVSVIVTEQYAAGFATTTVVAPNADGSWSLPTQSPSISYSHVLVSAQATDAAGNVSVMPPIDVIYSGETLNSGGSVTGALVLRGQLWLFGGKATGTTVFSGGVELNQGTSTGSLIKSGAQQHVYTHGTSTGATIEAGGFQDIWDGNVVTPDGLTKAIDTVLFGNQQVLHGGTAIHTEIKAGGQQYVNALGASRDNVIDAGGVQFVAAGGSDIDATIAGTQYLSGTASSTTIGAGGVQYDYGTSSGALVESGGSQHVYQGGNADGTNVAAGGYQDVYQGSVSNTVLDGQQQVLAGGQASGTTIDAGGRQYVGAGGASTGTTIAIGGFQYVDAGATDTGASINGGWQYVVGTASGASVSDRGEQDVGAGGTATNSHLDGGTEHVYAGGLTQNVDFGGSAGSTLVLDAPAGLTGSIANFGADDYIDFRNTVISGVDIDSANNLTVTTDGGQSYSWALLAQYSASSFALSSDGSGGTVLSYVPPQQTLLAAAH